MASNKGQLDTSVAEAQSALLASSHQPLSKADNVLDAIHDKAVAVSSNTLVNTALSTEAFSLVKEQVSNFVENSKILMNIMDELGKAHPFVQVAVSIFKVGLTLELARRDNDSKVIALHVEMNSMMSTLTMLKKVASPKDCGSDGVTIEERMSARMVDIAETIKLCIKLCDSYHKRHTAMKLLTSFKWQAKFTDIAQQFAKHKSAIQYDLSIHASVSIVAAAGTIDVVNKKMDDLMAAVFERMQTAEERELSAFIKEKGGPEAVTKSDELLETVWKKQKSHGETSDGTGKRKEETRMTASEIRKDVNKDLDTLLKENERTFNQKFEAQRIQIEEVKNTVIRESDRVIGSVLAGPHDRVIDKDMHTVWREMGWKGSVKARHLVLAIRDYFAEKHNSSLHGTHRSPTFEAQTVLSITTDDVEGEVDLLGNSNSQLVLSGSSSELWALPFINVYRIQPLIEAMDDDMSSFVTISEINAFVSDRPQNWSLPRWIAYWTVGFEMTTYWYYNRITILLGHLAQATTGARDDNRNIVSGFMRSSSMFFVHSLLSGISESGTWKYVNYSTFEKFQDYVVEEELHMKTVLEAIAYYVDDENTLSLVGGKTRPERFIMPLLYLLLNRALRVVDLAQTTRLHLDELIILQNSIDQAMSSVWERIENLKEIFRLQNLDVKEQAHKFFFGAYQNMFDFSVADHMDTLPTFPSSLDLADRVSSYDSLWYQEPIILYHGPQDDNVLEFGGSPTEATVLRDPAKEVASPLVGYWCGWYDYGLVSFSITTVYNDGTFTGYGSGYWGKFLVEGTVSGTSISFDRQYLPCADLQRRATNFSLRYVGELNEDMDKISGQSGFTPENGTEFEADDHFVVMRRPHAYFHALPSFDELRENRTRTLWTIAINAVLNQIRPWNYMRQLRDRRKAAIDSFLEDVASDRPGDFDVTRTLPEFTHYWRTLGIAASRRMIVNDESCDSCERSPIGSTRLLCLECSGQSYTGTIDLCPDCIDKDAQRVRDDKHHDAASHASSILQTRSVQHITGDFARRIRAREKISLYANIQVEAEGSEDPSNTETETCVVCQKVAARPSWLCIDCEDRTIVCSACNDDITKQQPWMELRPSKQVHDWEHSLARLVPFPQAEAAASPIEEAAPSELGSLQAKVADLEGKLTEFESVTDRRLGEMHTVLRQLLTLVEQIGVTSTVQS